MCSFFVHFYLFCNVPFGLHFLCFATNARILPKLSSSLSTMFSFDSFMDLIQRLLIPQQKYTTFNRPLGSGPNRLLIKVLKKLL